MKETPRLERILRVGSTVAIVACAVDMLQSAFTGKTALEYILPHFSSLQAYTTETVTIASNLAAKHILNRGYMLDRYGTTDTGEIANIILEEAQPRYVWPKKIAPVHNMDDYRR